MRPSDKKDKIAVAARPLRLLSAYLVCSAMIVGGVIGQERILAVLEERLAANPRDPAALEELGAEHLRRGDHSRAFIELQKSIAVAPERGTPYYHLGLLYFEKGLYFKEIEAYQKALRHSPDFLPARLNLGHAYLSVGKIPDAVEQYTYVVRRDPGNLTVLYNLGIVLADMNQPAEARRYLTKYLQLAPQGDPAGARAAGLLAELDEKETRTR